MIITEGILLAACPTNKHVGVTILALNTMLPRYEIDTPKRIAMFLAQCGHESMDFNKFKENLNYSANALRRVWPKRFCTDEIANEYARQPIKIANKVYADRMGNGPEESGDGWRFHGRGAIQITGKSNYIKLSEALMLPLLEVVEYLDTLNGAIESACWFWNENNLNKYADHSDIKGCTKAINGGFNGLSDREEKYAAVLPLLTT